MSEETQSVAEYVDGNGNTWQMTEEMAKTLGYKPVGSAVEAKVVEAEPKTKPAPARRTATTK